MFERLHTGLLCSQIHTGSLTVTSPVTLYTHQDPCVPARPQAPAAEQRQEHPAGGPLNGKLHCISWAHLSMEGRGAGTDPVSLQKGQPGNTVVTERQRRVMAGSHMGPGLRVRVWPLPSPAT